LIEKALGNSIASLAPEVREGILKEVKLQALESVTGERRP
jgi:hypothetical protein